MSPDQSAPYEAPSGAFLAKLGIVDRPTGMTAALDAHQVLLDSATTAVKLLTDWTLGFVVLSGLISRGIGIYEGSVAAIEANNPYATFTLIRAFAENAAAVLYVKDHPEEISKRWINPQGKFVRIGQITDYASVRFGGFGPIYDQLSGFAHPSARSVIASHNVAPSDPEDDDRRIQLTWQSRAAFRTEGDAMLACGWLVELAQAHAHLFLELAETVRDSPKDDSDEVATQ